MTAMAGTRRNMRAVSYALVSAVVGVVVMRLIIYFVPLSSDTYAQSLAVDALFSLPTQLIFFLIIPFCIYKFYGKRTVQKTLAFSSAHKRFSPWWLLALPLGFCVWMVTLGVSSGWLTMLDLLGYNYSSSEPPLPTAFNAGFFFAEVFMTAVLPAVCEEFVMRGGLVTTMKKKLGTAGCILFGAVAFGLFHQNVRQVFYTALFGALATYLTIKLNSIYPAMIMHFTNNFCSVFFRYAQKYNWLIGGGMLNGINAIARNSYIAFFLMLVALFAVGAGIVYLLVTVKTDKDKKRVTASALFTHTPSPHAHAIPTAPAQTTVAEGAPTATATETAQAEGQAKKAALREWMIILGVAVVTVLTTLSTFVWGYFV